MEATSIPNGVPAADVEAEEGEGQRFAGVSMPTGVELVLRGKHGIDPLLLRRGGCGQVSERQDVVAALTGVAAGDVACPNGNDKILWLPKLRELLGA
mmetsp:Transcript_97654/g.244730  ORF Transcript_97654/g.244730 Transcript_97654/m.244730 type:complete len:97 (-) Transcript_97654:238-528(-)